MTVRLATKDDEDALYDLLVDTHRTSPFHELIPYRAEKVLAAIQMGTQQRNGKGLIGVIDGENKIVASVGLLLDEWWWSDAPCLFLKWIYVRPEARHGTGHYRELFEFIGQMREKLLEGTDLPFPLLVELVHDSAIDDPALVEMKDRLFARYGRKVGSVFLMGLPEP